MECKYEKHKVFHISYYKRDCFLIKCECGKEDLVGTWFSCLEEWDKKQWGQIGAILALFNESLS